MTHIFVGNNNFALQRTDLVNFNNILNEKPEALSSQALSWISNQPSSETECKKKPPKLFQFTPGILHFIIGIVTAVAFGMVGAVYHLLTAAWHGLRSNSERAFQHLKSAGLDAFRVFTLSIPASLVFAVQLNEALATTEKGGDKIKTEAFAYNK